MRGNDVRITFRIFLSYHFFHMSLLLDEASALPPFPHNNHKSFTQTAIVSIDHSQTFRHIKCLSMIRFYNITKAFRS